MKRILLSILVIGVLFLSACGAPTTAPPAEAPPTPPPTEQQNYTLTISVSPSGAGSVWPSSGQYIPGLQVTLTATPASGYAFDYWDGAASSTSATITITMDSDKSITAHFAATTPPPTEEPPPTPSVGLSRDNPLPMGESLVTPEGIEVTVVNLIKGNQAWEIIHEANMFNDPPASGMQYIIITVKVKNISSEEEPESVSDWDFELIGSSNKVFHGTERSVVLPDEGSLSGLWVDLYHGGKETGSLDFYVPADETNLVLIWDCSYNIFKENKRFFEVR